MLSTRGNLNNDIGLPLTLLGLSAAHRAAVIEMGMNHPGEIAYLAAIGAPHRGAWSPTPSAPTSRGWAIWTRWRAKRAIFTGLPAEGVAVINADDAYAGYWRGVAAGRPVRSFAIDGAADVVGKVRQHGLETAIDLSAPEGEVHIAWRPPGAP